MYGKSYAGRPHAHFDEGEAALEKTRRGSLLCMVLVYLFSVAAAFLYAEPRIWFNEDNEHFYACHPPEDMTEEGCSNLVRTYAGFGEFKGILFCINMQRALYDSDVWERFKDQENPVQPGYPRNLRLLSERGVDQFAVWLDETRRHGMKAYLSMRMNDSHGLKEFVHGCKSSKIYWWHSKLWEEHPEWRRAPWRDERSWEGSFDFSREEVRRHMLALVREAFGKWDFDGFELDWMRWGMFFSPGAEREGAALMTDFVREVGRIRDEAERRVGHKIALAHRIPPDPRLALGHGFDVAAWAHAGCVQMVTLSGFEGLNSFDPPIALWHRLLKPGTEINVIAGRGVASDAFNRSSGMVWMRGGAATAWAAGADGIYLFNECYREPKETAALEKYLHEIASPESLGKLERWTAVTMDEQAMPGDSTRTVLPMPLSNRYIGVDFSRMEQNMTVRLSAPLVAKDARCVLDLCFDAATPDAAVLALPVRVNTAKVGLTCSGICHLRRDNVDLRPDKAFASFGDGRDRFPRDAAKVVSYVVPGEILHDFGNAVELLPEYGTPGNLVWAQLRIDVAESNNAQKGNGSDVSGRRMVWAHHVPWHTPDNQSLTTLGYYNWPSDDVTDTPYEDEIRRAISMGIDGFFFDAVTHKGHTAYSNLSPFLKAAEGTDFMCAVCLDVKTDVTNQIVELKKMLDLNAGHPNYARYHGKPVVMTYTFLPWTPDEWREIRKGLSLAGWDIWLVGDLARGYKPYDESLIERYADVFDAAYFFVYNIVREPSVRGMNECTAALCARRGKLYMPCLNPGYYGAWLNGRNDFYHPYRCLDTLQETFEAAMAVSPQWLHITTWNDHDETSVCPRRLTPGFVPLVRAYSDALKGKTPPSRADVLLAYNREVFAGTLTRFEAMRLPSLDGGVMKIGIRLLDASGTVVAELPVKTFSGKPWERVEWLVPTADIAATPVLVPQVAVRDGAGVRRVNLPPEFLVRGWLEDAETVRIAMSDCVAGDASLAVEYRGGRITASLSLSSETEVKRATLFRNGRPLAQFAPDDEKGEAQVAFSVSGAGSWVVAPEGGRIVSARRQFAKNDQKGDFKWDATRVASYNTPAWSKNGVLVAGGDGLSLVLSGGKDKRRVPVADFVKSRAVMVGGMTYSIAPDPTLHTRRPWNTRAGKAKLALFDRMPRETDAFWVRVECVDGRLFASRPVWPFAKDVAVGETELVETAVTMEKTSGACGTPGAREFLAPPEEVPIKDTRIVRRKASPLTLRRSLWNFDGSGVNEFGDRFVTGIPASAYIDRKGGGKALRFDGKGAVKPRLPLRMWPSGPATISFDVNPEPFDGRRQDILVRTGWMDGLSVRLTGDGCVAVERSALNPEEQFVLKGVTPIAPKKWTRVTASYDGAKLRILINGKLDVEGECPIVRRYGNCTVSIGGEGAAAFRGQFDSLYISGEYEGDRSF